MIDRKAEVIAIVGGQWGDEGKGKVVDYVAQNADVVGRGQGGDNAGHTVINEYGKFALHQIPSGIFNPYTVNIIGSGVVLNPKSLLSEMATLSGKGISLDRLVIDYRTHLLFDYHKVLDGYQEDGKGKKCIGTTKKGIGPAYVDKTARVGLRAHLLENPENCLKELKFILEQKRREYRSLSARDEFRLDYYADIIHESSRMLWPHITDTQEIIEEYLNKGSKIVAEGAQGTLLDLDYGTYPYVTSSRTLVGGVLLGLGIPPQYLTRSIGVVKAYQTRVGEGGMPTELKDEQGELIRQKGHEFGTTTGRPRRVGYFDGVAARYSQRTNHFTDIAITRLDILSGVGELKVCSSYLLGNSPCSFPVSEDVLDCCKPFYGETGYGWEEDISSVREFDELPLGARVYAYILNRHFPNARLSFIGVGPSREALIVV